MSPMLSRYVRVMSLPPSTPPSAGWYTNSHGQRQWWDGVAWGPLAENAHVQRTSPVAPLFAVKSRTPAYLLAIFLGGVGAHRFYLRKIGTAWIFIVLWVIGFLFGIDPDPRSTVIAGLIFAVMALWLIIDLFRIPSMVDGINQAEWAKHTAGPTTVSPTGVELYPLREDWRS